MKPSRIAVAAAILCPFVWVFGAALARGELFVFRDAAHFYYPLFEWVCRQWAEGEIPLWNPHENCGAPVLADASPSIFYPGKLLFALPLPYDAKYVLYITGHVLLAALAAFHVARRWGASTLASGACAVSYAYSGSVLFQYCNVVFLVGAAWLPWALLAADRMLVRRSTLSAIWLGAVLALMTLGGDPQAAYHAGLLAVLYAVLAGRVRGPVQRVGKGPQYSPALPKPSASWAWLASRRPSMLALAAATGAALAAVQVLPAAQWARQSVRASFVAPRSIYEIPTSLKRRAVEEANREASASNAAGRLDASAAIGAGLLGSPARGEHHDQIYHFSIGPWRCAEFVWPNLYGRLFPTHRRWIDILPAEGRVWTPSLYMGLLPLLSACSVWRLRTRSPRVRFLSWAVLLSGLGSFGWYGLGWLLAEIRSCWWGPSAGPQVLGEPVGGIYWLMVAALPGYVYFRYPAKLTVVASLGLSLLAARGWDRIFRGGSPGIRRSLAWLCGLSLAAAVAAAALWPFWPSWMEAAPADAAYGPLQPTGAFLDLLTALLHTAVLSACLWRLLGRSVRGSRLWAAPIALCLTAVELAAAHGWLAPTAPARLWHTRPLMAGRIAAEEIRTGGGEPFRVYRGWREDWQPASWSGSSSRHRLAEGLAWDRDTLFPKFHLGVGDARGRAVSVVEAYGSLQSRDFSAVMRVSREHGPRRADGVREPHRSVLDALGTKYLILPNEPLYPGLERVGPAAAELDGAVLGRNPFSLPRAWVVHRFESLPPLADDSDPVAVEQRTRDVWFPGGRPRDLRDAAVVESDWTVPSGAPPAGNSLSSCSVVVDRPCRVEIQANLAAPGIVVLSDLYDPGWTAEALSDGSGRGRSERVLRVDRILRGVYLPAGRHRIVYRYRPQSFRIGLAVSGLSWSALLAVWLSVRRRRLSHPKVVPAAPCGASLARPVGAPFILPPPPQD